MSTAPRARSGLAIAAVAAIVMALLTRTPTGAAAAGAPQSDGATSGATIDTGSALVVLSGDPLSTSSNVKKTPGKKLELSSASVKSERAALAAQRNAFKTWLRANAPKAKVTGEYDLALNAVGVTLNGTSMATLRSSSLVRTAQYQTLYRPLDDTDPDLSIVHAIEAWKSSQVGGSANAGRGIKVGVVDTGIDIRHPCFDDAGFPQTRQLGDTRFTNNKVIVAKVFSNNAKVLGLTPEAVQSHGTHVAGTVACNLDTPATVNGVDVPYDVSGVAPAAQLGNYNVFPANVPSVRTEDLVNAMETAFADGMDVINMSLGGGSSGSEDLGTTAVNNLDRAGMVVAVAAGNSGPGHFTVESPGMAERALSAGASSVGHFTGAPIRVGSASFPGATGDFPTVAADLTAPLGVAAGGTNGLSEACAPLPAGSLTGTIAVVSRGTCGFSVKLRAAQDAGAVAAVVVNNIGGDPSAMGSDGTPNQATIPAYMVPLSAAGPLVAADGQDATISATQAYVRSTNDNIMASFSSQGPTDASFRRVKPDVVAPGVNVLSSFPLQFCGESADSCWSFLNGTSMATPHLAGMAAVVRGAHPTWTAEQVRSAVVNTAGEGLLRRSSAPGATEIDVNVTGTGLANLANAVAAKVALGPVSTSFGTVPSRSGQSRQSTVALTNLTGAPVTVTASIDSVLGSGVTFATGGPVTIPAGGTVSLPVSATVGKGAAAGDHSATLRLSSGGTSIAHSVLYVFVG